MIKEECSNCCNLKNFLKCNILDCDAWEPDYLAFKKEIKRLEELIIKKDKYIDSLKEILNEFIPIKKLDEANDMVIKLVEGTYEEMGRDLLNRNNKKGK